MFWFQKREKNPAYFDGYTEEALLAKDAEIIGIWEELRAWFSEQGYTLYDLKGWNVSQPLLETDDDTLKWSGAYGRKDEPPEWPYAYYGGNDPSEVPHPFEATLTTKVCFAQDRQGRHVAIKRLEVLEDTEEKRINRFLFEHQEEAAKNCILPIIEILDYKNQTFAVMPRWGESPCMFETIADIMRFIHCLLKAINFMHLHHIIHRDITEANILVNHFGCHGYMKYGNWLRPLLLSRGKLTYALFDFDLSLMLSSGERRLPSWRSFEIRNIIWPNDTRQGELDYDPFVFEMGCVGIQLCMRFQRCIPVVPMMAPFLDRLITDNLDERFTSSQALAFFEQMYEELTPTQLTTPVPLDAQIYAWKPGDHDRWHGLPKDFLTKWGSYRAPMPTLYTRILRRVCMTSWGWRVVQGVRRSMKNLKALFYKSAVSGTNTHIQ